MNELTLSVSDLNNYIKNIFDAEEMLIGINVFGEITNYKNSGKMVFFDLKDDKSSLSCVCFVPDISISFKNGDKVNIKGHLNYSVKIGRLSFVVSKISSLGKGEIYQKYLELKDKLEKEGLFEEKYKKQLIEVPKRIGIVTSETGAVIHDIIKVTRTKNHAVDLVLYPVKVQGLGAEQDIIRGIEFFNDYPVDVVIVARGGGSFEDYAPFNSESVARCVFNSKKPIVSSIGHESDWSLIDFVADVRASTPSVAAEIAVFDLVGFKNRYYDALNHITYILSDFINTKSSNLNEKIRYMLANMETHKLDAKHYLDIIVDKIFEKTHMNLLDYKNKLDIVTLNIERINPLGLLKKGYTKVYKDNKNILSVKDLKIDDELDVTFIDGRVKTKITNIEVKNHEVWTNNFRIGKNFYKTW